MLQYESTHRTFTALFFNSFYPFSHLEKLLAQVHEKKPRDQGTMILRPWHRFKKEDVIVLPNNEQYSLRGSFYDASVYGQNADRRLNI